MKIFLLVILQCLVFCFQKTESSSFPNARIIGGDEIKPHSLPFVVFLNFTGKDNTTWTCGGSLITRSYILTSGTCAYSASTVEVTLGAHNISTTEATQMKQLSEDIVVHPSFKKDVAAFVYENDIAVVHLPESVELTDSIQLVKLPSDDANDTYVNETGKISGWGQLNTFNSSTSSVLLSLENTIISNEECTLVYYDLKDYDVCMLTIEEESPCVGDYGSPLMVGDVQVAIASQNVPYCIPGYPFVYTRVQSFLDWIRETTDYVV